MLRLIVCLLLFASASSADDDIYPRVTDNIVDSVCRDVDGVPVTFIASEPLGEPAYAELDEHTGMPMVYIDPHFIKEWYSEGFGDEAKTFVLLHECAHHHLGHIKHDDVFYTGTTSHMFTEMNADCLAAKWMALQYGRASVRFATQTLSDINDRTRNRDRSGFIHYCADHLF